MLRRPLLTLTLALVLATAFCVGVARLMALRYEGGEVYPPYSTLRPDPLGAKGIYASLANLSGVEVQRNFLPLKKLHPAEPITLVYLGVPRWSFWTEREVQELETLLFGGARVVITFFPFERSPDPGAARMDLETQRRKKQKRLKEEKEGKEEKDERSDSKEDRDEEKEKDSGILPFDKVAKRFGFQFASLPAEEGEAYHRRAFLFEPGAQLERDLSWHSALCFSELSPEWKPLYLSETKPVVIERSFGRGSIVLAADSYFLSNEALRVERHPQLLSRIFSGPPHLVFDEDHLGVSEQTGIAQLALKYRLHGVVAGLVLLAALFVWKNAVRFVPAHASAGNGETLVSGREAAQGFDNLLHRAIKPADVLGVCIEEWRRTQTHPVAALAAVDAIHSAEQARPPRQRDAVAAYREIVRRLSRQPHCPHS